MFRVIVTGCRDWSDREAVFAALDSVTGPASSFEDVMIVHGACTDYDTGELSGADRWADEWSKERHSALETHPADWRRYRKAAGPIRNKKMALLGADLCIAFWDGMSPGTGDMISEAIKSGIPVRIVPRGLSK